MPGPESSSSSASTPPRAVLLKRVITSPALRPACSAGPPGVIPSIRAPTLSPAVLARVSTITPIRPRLSENQYTPNGPPSTRTRGRLRGRERSRVSCADDAAAGHRVQTASAASASLRIIVFSSRGLEPDVTSARGAGLHQLPHQPNALLPQPDQLGIALVRAFDALRECAVENGNAVFQLREQRGGLPAQHAAFDVVLLKRVFECRGLLLCLAELGMQTLTRRPEQQNCGERGGEREAAGPRAPGAAAP